MTSFDYHTIAWMKAVCFLFAVMSGIQGMPTEVFIRGNNCPADISAETVFMEPPTSRPCVCTTSSTCLTPLLVHQSQEHYPFPSADECLRGKNADDNYNLQIGVFLSTIHLALPDGAMTETENMIKLTMGSQDSGGGPERPVKMTCTLEADDKYGDKGDYTGRKRNIPKEFFSGQSGGSDGSRGNKNDIIIALSVVLIAVVLAVVAGLLVVYIRRRRKNREVYVMSAKSSPSADDELGGLEHRSLHGRVGSTTSGVYHTIEERDMVAGEVIVKPEPPPPVARSPTRSMTSSMTSSQGEAVQLSELTTSQDISRSNAPDQRLSTTVLSTAPTDKTTLSPDLSHPLDTPSQSSDHQNKRKSTASLDPDSGEITLIRDPDSDDDSIKRDQNNDEKGVVGQTVEIIDDGKLNHHDDDERNENDVDVVKEEELHVTPMSHTALAYEQNGKSSPPSERNGETSNGGDYTTPASVRDLVPPNPYATLDKASKETDVEELGSMEHVNEQPDQNEDDDYTRPAPAEPTHPNPYASLPKASVEPQNDEEDYTHPAPTGTTHPNPYATLPKASVESDSNETDSVEDANEAAQNDDYTTPGAIEPKPPNLYSTLDKVNASIKDEADVTKVDESEGRDYSVPFRVDPKPPNPYATLGQADANEESIVEVKEAIVEVIAKGGPTEDLEDAGVEENDIQHDDYIHPPPVELRPQNPYATLDTVKAETNTANQ